jgi:hypothetical protein
MPFCGVHLGVVNNSHMLFADNSLISCGAKPNHLRYLHALFLSFETASDLKINLAKQKMLHVGNVENVDGLAGIFGCGVSSLPLKYLGLKLEASFKA